MGGGDRGLRRLAAQDGAQLQRTSDYGFGRSFQCAQELWAGLSRELGSGRTRVEELGSRSGRSRRLPILKRFPSKSAERRRGKAADGHCRRYGRTSADAKFS
jgi:hypothetical protein